MSWKQTYQDLDNATLLSLIPLLQDRIDSGKTDFERSEQWLVDKEKAAERCQGWLDQALDMQRNGHDVDGFVEEFTQSLQLQSDAKPKDERFYAGMFAYLCDLQTRLLWIKDVESVRRGLLPGLDDFLHGDLPQAERVN